MPALATLQDAALEEVTVGQLMARQLMEAVSVIQNAICMVTAVKMSTAQHVIQWHIQCINFSIITTAIYI